MTNVAAVSTGRVSRPRRGSTLSLSSDLQPVLVLALTAFAVLLPWEVSRALIPVARTESVGGVPVSVIDASRLVALPLLLLVPLVLRWDRSRSAIAVAIATVVVHAVSAVHSPDLAGATTELIRLGISLTVLLAAASLTSLQDVTTVLRWYRRSMVVIALMMSAQAVTGWYAWNAALGGRANGPFADPNIAGRFLVVAMVIAVGDLLGARRRRTEQLWGLAGVAALGFALAASGSRSAWLAAAVVGAGAIVLPTYRFVRRAGVVGAILAVPAAIAVLLLVPSIADRISSVFGAGAGLGSRRSLIRAGLAMWQDHPVLGLGLSGYDVGILGEYSRYQGYYGAAQSASHTSLVTTLADSGLLGIALLGLIGGILAAALRRGRDAGWLAGGRERMVCGAGIAVVFLSSQSEGRFWEEPLLWLLLGLALAPVLRPGQRISR